MSKEMGTLVYGQDFFYDAWISTETPSYTIFEFAQEECPNNPTMECFPQYEDVGKSYLMNVGSDSFHVDLYQCMTPGVGCASSSDLDDQFSQGTFVFHPFNATYPSKRFFFRAQGNIFGPAALGN